MERYKEIIIIVVIIVGPFLIIPPVLGEELELLVLESKLNENSITGVIQNPHNYTVHNIQVRAEFYDKEDGHLVGLRDLYEAITKDELKPNEKLVYKIHEHVLDTEEFPNTDFIVKAEGYDNPDEGGLFSGLIKELRTLEQEAKNATKAIEGYNEKARALNLTGKDK